MATFESDRNGAASSDPFPLRLGSAEDFARVESLLKAAGFDEPTICRVLKIESVSAVGSVDPAKAEVAAAGSERLALLVRVFLFMQSIPCEEVERTLEASEIESLTALDLLRAGRFDVSAGGSVEKYYAPVLLYPVAGFVCASDRYTHPDGSRFEPPPDIVFPAIYAGTLRFLRIISQKPASDALDLCSGTGIGAMVLGRCSERVMASDITARAAHFAKFNCLLNRCHNVQALQGDLYEAVGDRTFDRIVAHPPYVPSFEQTQVYRDAGETGETLVRRIIEGLPIYLRPGGTFYCVSAGWDADDGLFEQRARTWLGEHQQEFDVIFALSSEMSPRKLAQQLVERANSKYFSEIARWDQIFARRGMQRQVYGAMVMRRRAEGKVGVRPLDPHPPTVRVPLSHATDGSCMDWALRWHRWRAQKNALGELTLLLSGCKPRLGSHLQVKITHVVKDSRFTPTEFMLESEKPFSYATRVNESMVSVLIDFNGQSTVKEIFQNAQKRSILPAGLSFDDFTTFVAELIERGYLEVDDAVFEI